MTDASSNIRQFTQDKNYFVYNTGGGILDLSKTSGIATTKTNFTFSLPNAIDCIGWFKGYYSASSGRSIYFFNKNEVDFTPTASNSDFHNDSTHNPRSRDLFKLVSNGVMAYRSTSTTASALNIYTKGWIDNNI